MTLRVRALSKEEAHKLARMTRSQKLGAGLVRRARIIQHAVDGLSAPGIAAKMDLCGVTVRFWLKRFNERGLPGLEEDMRSGRSPTYTAEERSAVIKAALSRPAELDLPFAHGPWIVWSPTSARRVLACGAAGSARCSWPRGASGARRRPGLAHGLIRGLPKKGGHRATLPRAARQQRRHLPRRDGAAGKQELSRAAPGQAGRTGAADEAVQVAHAGPAFPLRPRS